MTNFSIYAFVKFVKKYKSGSMINVANIDRGIICTCQKHTKKILKNLNFFQFSSNEWTRGMHVQENLYYKNTIYNSFIKLCRITSNIINTKYTHSLLKMFKSIKLRGPFSVNVWNKVKNHRQIGWLLLWGWPNGHLQQIRSEISKAYRFQEIASWKTKGFWYQIG